MNTSMVAKASAKTIIAGLVDKFDRDKSEYLKASFNETATRTQFITPLLEALGWDVRNTAGLPVSFREVVEEASVEVDQESATKRPDYALLAGQDRKLFVEAKKPSVNIALDRPAAFQTRRYVYSASLKVSILTNFRQLSVYDCAFVARTEEDASQARLEIISYNQYVDRFEYLWSNFSREAVFNGDFDANFASMDAERGHEPFDKMFLSKVRRWRAVLAVDMYQNNASLTAERLSYAVQLFLSRIVFLRICEDRSIEKYSNLQKLPSVDTFKAFLKELKRADDFYNSGLFDLLEDGKMGITISDGILYSIIAELYYPSSPYTFAVVESQVLGEIYEQFLGEVITVVDGEVHIDERQEVRESGGVVPTPQYIVIDIIRRTLVSKIANKSPDQLKELKICDPCCGSAIFMLAAADYLFSYHLDWYASNDPLDHVGTRIVATVGSWRLTFEERRRILTDHLFGIDVDASAVEVARFSLLLKLIEDESAEGLKDFVKRKGKRALPRLDETVVCGNTLISMREWSTAFGLMTAADQDKINPFEWNLQGSKGQFDVIIANPPYTKSCGRGLGADSQITSPSIRS